MIDEYHSVTRDFKSISFFEKLVNYDVISVYFNYSPLFISFMKDTSFFTFYNILFLLEYIFKQALARLLLHRILFVLMILAVYLYVTAILSFHQFPVSISIEFSSYVTTYPCMLRRSKSDLSKGGCDRRPASRAKNFLNFYY